MHLLLGTSTCGTLLELLVFLFPPFPGLEDAPQGGQLAVASDGWSVDAGHQAPCPQHPLLVHQLYCRDRQLFQEDDTEEVCVWGGWKAEQN